MNSSPEILYTAIFRPQILVLCMVVVFFRSTGSEKRVPLWRPVMNMNSGD